MEEIIWNCPKCNAENVDSPETNLLMCGECDAVDIDWLVVTDTSSAKSFYTMYGVGKAKYLVGFHDGASFHKDGSPFFDIRIFKNKKVLESFISELKTDGYIES